MTSSGTGRVKPDALGSRRVKRGYEQVADQLQRDIMAGTIPTGTRLPTEPELAEHFGTSRSTIREALRILASQRIVETRPGNSGGSVVTRPSSEDVSEYLMLAFALWTDETVEVQDLFDARETMEIASVGWAASRSAGDAVETLSRFLPDDVTDLDDEQILIFDRGFHEAILGLAGNRFIQTVSLPIYDVLNKRVHRNLIAPSFWPRMVEEHRQLMAAIAAGDSAGARTLMEEHMRAVRLAYAPVIDDEEGEESG
ncbi:FadR family transcriptional regulator [Actinoplanes bogorensis]|uniref:FadR family transcriptional regulator n=1 Tax=Paractinoplanes bogorensis TaxID=1610840 RepID=A0ABS5YUU8_9ACTN|nr:FadR/GntR family transcriptional regulator [Actinoplanes bogorensis]MBU2667190.1 FadR family transcriptional regulator [Actinoplanes bogorensis]